MISYCIASFRPTYSRLLIEDLVRKTTAAFEILVWLNVDDPEFKRFCKDSGHRVSRSALSARRPRTLACKRTVCYLSRLVTSSSCK